MKKIIALLILISCNSISAESLHELAYSSAMGVKVFVDKQTGNWCVEKIELFLEVDNKNFFGNDLQKKLMPALAKVFSSQCSEALSADVTGYVKGSKKVIYRATTTKSANWNLAKAEKNIPEPDEPGKIKKDATASTQIRYPNFEINGWRPPSRIDEFQIDPNVKEYIVSTSDKSCSFRYNDLHNLDQLPFIIISTKKVSCLNGFVHGKGEVKVHLTDGRLLNSYRGQFSQGYFTGDKRGGGVFEKPFISRHIGSIDAYIGSDSELSIHYIAVLVKRYSSSWSFCQRPEIIAITDNNNLFDNNPSLIQQIVNTAGTYVKQYCPKIRNFQFSARTHLTENDRTRLFYVSSVKREKNQKNWTFSSLNVKNYAKQRVKKAQKLHQDLQNTGFKERLAFLYGNEKINNPITLTADSVIYEKSISGRLLVNITEVDDDIAITEWPYEITISDVVDKITESGWYIINGELDVDNIENKDEYGIPISNFILDSYIKCQKEFCEEANDIVQTVRLKTQILNWEPSDISGKQE